MPPFPLRERLDFDRTHSMKHFLANTVHGIDFIATRDRGAPGGSRWSFKRCDQDDVTVPSLSYRLPLRPFFANIFGQLDYKRDMADGSIFMRLCCPTNVGCRVQKAYQDQLEQLKDALVEDVRFADSDTVSSSWLSLASGRTVFQQKEGCFYLLVPPEVWKDRAIAGGVFEADVSLSRFQQEVRGEISQKYSLRVHEIWALSEHDLPSNDVTYQCDLNPGVGCSLCS